MRLAIDVESVSFQCQSDMALAVGDCLQQWSAPVKTHGSWCVAADDWLRRLARRSSSRDDRFRQNGRCSAGIVAIGQVQRRLDARHSLDDELVRDARLQVSHRCRTGLCRESAMASHLLMTAVFHLR